MTDPVDDALRRVLTGDGTVIRPHHEPDDYVTDEAVLLGEIRDLLIEIRDLLVSKL